MATKPAPQPAPARKSDKDMGPEVRNLGGYRPAPAARFPTVVRRTEIIILCVPRRQRKSNSLVKFGPYA